MKWPNTHKMDDAIAEAIEEEEMTVVVPLQLAIHLQETADNAKNSVTRCRWIDAAGLTPEEALAMVKQFANQRIGNPKVNTDAVSLYRALTNCELKEALDTWDGTPW